MNYKRLFIIVSIAFLATVGINIYQAHVVKTQRVLILDMWLYINSGARGHYQGEPITCASWRP